MHPSALFSYNKHAGIFKKTREVHVEEHEAQLSASRTSQVFLKTPKCLCNWTIHEEQVFYFFSKMFKKLHMIKLMT